MFLHESHYLTTFISRSCSLLSSNKNLVVYTSCQDLQQMVVVIIDISRSAQKLGNDVWHDSEKIATKVCSQICPK